MPILIMLFVVICALGVAIWLVQIQKREAKQQIQDIQTQLDASFVLSGYLLDSQDEKAAVLAAIRVGRDLLKAEGYAFIPFTEWKQTVPVLKDGGLSFLDEPNWQARLSNAETRHACRNCVSRQAGPECILLGEDNNPEQVYCLALRCGGREIGVVNYFFSERPKVTESQRQFLDQIARLTDLTLDSMRVHAQEINALRSTRQPVISDDELSQASRELIDNLRYQAVLNERSRLAREIHDGLAQTLAFLKMEAGRMQAHAARGEIHKLTKVLHDYYQTLSDVYLDARQAIDNLRRAPDEDFSTWLRHTAADYKTLTGMEIDISHVVITHDFPNTIKIQLVRIIQESLTNIRKHAQADEISIAAFERGNEAIIEIKDNGLGFAPEDVDNTSQYGLRSMRERANSISADFQIISAPGMGTTVRLQIPIREKANS